MTALRRYTKPIRPNGCQKPNDTTWDCDEAATLRLEEVDRTTCILADVNQECAAHENLLERSTIIMIENSRPLMVWKADTVQGVLFTMPGSKQLSALEVWRIVSPHIDPEAFQGGGTANVGVSQASGTNKNFSLAVSAQIGRIDLIISPKSSETADQMPPQLEDLDKALGLYKELVALLAQKCRVARISVVTQLSVHFEEPAQAVKFLNEETGLSFPAGSSDNIYQTNIRKAYLSEPKFQMNRVFTLSSAAKQLVSAQFDFASPNLGFSSAIIIPIASLKIDINSATSADITDLVIGLTNEHVAETYRLIEKNLEALDE